jgi:hypothetical protein
MSVTYPLSVGDGRWSFAVRRQNRDLRNALRPTPSDGLRRIVEFKLDIKTVAV